jgi:hypothetical protein
VGPPRAGLDAGRREYFISAAENWTPARGPSLSRLRSLAGEHAALPAVGLNPGLLSENPGHCAPPIGRQLFVL